MSAPRVTVVVVTYNSQADITRCLDALASQTAVSLELLVVDNASTDGTVDLLRARGSSADPLASKSPSPSLSDDVGAGLVPALLSPRREQRLRLIANAENVGFSRANNQALRLAAGEYVLFLNPDTILSTSALGELVRLLDERPKVALVGPLTRNGDGTPQVSFGPRLTLLNEWRQRGLVEGVRQRHTAALAKAALLVGAEQHPDWISASCALARREPLEALGGFDERFFLYEEDVDLCVRLRAAGWDLVHHPGAEALHLLGRSMSTASARARIEYQRSHVAYYRKHHGALQRLGLQLVLASAALVGWLRAKGPEGRALQAELLRIALFR